MRFGLSCAATWWRSRREGGCGRPSPREAALLVGLGFVAPAARVLRRTQSEEKRQIPRT